MRGKGRVTVGKGRDGERKEGEGKTKGMTVVQAIKGEMDHEVTMTVRFS